MPNQRCLYVRLPSDAEQGDEEAFEFATMRLRPPLVRPISFVGNSDAVVAVDAAGFSPDQLERVCISLFAAFIFMQLICLQVKLLAQKDAMYPLTPSDLAAIWQARLQLRNIEEALPKVLPLM